MNKDIIKACTDKRLFGPWFAKDPESWVAWDAFLRALFGLEMPANALQIFKDCTGRSTAPSAPARTAWLCCGRGAGKSLMVSLTSVYLAAFRDWRPYLQKGEVATVLVIAADRSQARHTWRYMREMITGIPMLAAMVERETAESFELNNGICLQIGTASYKTTRGYSFAGVIADEIAFWPMDLSVNPDSEIINAVMPGLARMPGSMLLCASSPYGKRGELWQAYKRHWGKDDSRSLFWKATTRQMNPTIPQEVVDDAIAKDAEKAKSEWLGEFRSDRAQFVDEDVIQSRIEFGCFERPCERKHKYVAFCDPSGGSVDSMTLAIAHCEGDHVLIDLLREVQAPFSPDQAVKEFAQELGRYGIKRVVGDKYAGEWVRESFRKKGVRYDTAEEPKSELYLSLLPALNAGTITLLDNKRAATQLAALERQTGRGGRDSIDHPDHANDDLANVVAGACFLAQGSARRGEIVVGHTVPDYAPRGSLGRQS